MTAYLLHYVDFVKDLNVLKFAEPKLADIYGFEKLPSDRSAKIVFGEESFKDHAQFSTSLLVAIYNALGPDKPVGKFESHSAAARRTFALLYAKYNQLEITNVTLAPSDPPIPVSTTKETMTMAKRPAKAKKAAAGNGRVVNSRAPGTVAEFKQTRAGTDRARVLTMMDGTMTPDAIAAAMGGRFNGKYVMAHAYCLRRDCAIGYDLTKDGNLIAVFPGKRTLEDAIKHPRTAPSPPAPAQTETETEAESEVETHPEAQPPESHADAEAA